MPRKQVFLRVTGEITVIIMKMTIVFIKINIIQVLCRSVYKFVKFSFITGIVFLTTSSAECKITFM